MKLSYTVLSTTFATADTDRLEDQEVLTGAVRVLANGFNIAEKSVWYLLQNGWSQSLQDSFAGPRAKAIKDGEDKDIVNEVILSSIEKRVTAIRDGMLASSGGGRDPIRSVGLQMLQEFVRSKGKTLPKDKVKKAEMLDKWIAVKRIEIEAEIARRRKMKGPEVELDDLFTEE